MWAARTRGVAKVALMASTAGPIGGSFVYSSYVYASTPEDQISESHTPYSIWVQSLVNFVMSKLGQRSLIRFQESCDSAVTANEEFLMELIERNKDTEYGKDYHLDEIKSREDFQKMHPITGHDHYEPYIQRVLDGKYNVMFQEHPRMIGETSGTSGTRKLLPINPLQRKIFFTEGIGITFGVLEKGIKEKTNGKILWPNLQKSCKLMFTPKYSTTDSGLKIGPNSSAPGDNKTLLQLYTTPVHAWEVEDQNEMLFFHCLYALLDKNMGFIESNFASGVFNFFVCLNDRWDELVETIRTGKLPEQLKIDDSIRIKLEKGLVSNPERADALEVIYRDRDKEGPSFARRLWPNLHTILAADTGSFKIYGEKLRKEWIGNDITIYSALYAATEGLIGVNPSMEAKTYVLQPRAIFFEFLPMDRDKKGTVSKDDQTPLFIEQLEPGKEYEVIITNLTGLYRYRFGDVVRCVGYKGEAPIVQVAYRKGQFLNAMGEQTSEETFYNALAAASSQDWNMQLGEYSAVEYFARKTGTRKPRYTVFVELKNKANGKQSVTRPLTIKEVDAFDRRLSQVNDMYALFRSNGRLHQAEVIPVKPGTFERVRKAMVEMGVSPSQLKVPRVLRNERLIEILEEESIGK